MGFIINFIKKLFKKEKTPMMIKEQSPKKQDTKFLDEIKSKTISTTKKEVEVRTNVGDGLGIQGKLEG